MEVRAQRERVNLLNQAKNQATFDAVMGHCNRDRFQEPNAVQYCIQAYLGCNHNEDFPLDFPEVFSAGDSAKL